jgi:hypothetical protein
LSASVQAKAVAAIDELQTFWLDKLAEAMKAMALAKQALVEASNKIKALEKDSKARADELAGVAAQLIADVDNVERPAESGKRAAPKEWEFSETEESHSIVEIALEESGGFPRLFDRDDMAQLLSSMKDVVDKIAEWRGEVKTMLRDAVQLVKT